jgi:hypothetical protein
LFCAYFQNNKNLSQVRWFVRVTNKAPNAPNDYQRGSQFPLLEKFQRRRHGNLKSHAATDNARGIALMSTLPKLGL